MSNKNQEKTLEWIHAPHRGLLTKPGLEGAACYGAYTCIARPQRHATEQRAEFEEHLEASQEAIRSWLAHEGSK